MGPADPEQTVVVLALIVLLDTVHWEKSGDPIQKNKKSTEPNFIILQVLKGLFCMCLFGLLKHLHKFLALAWKHPAA